MKREYYEIVEDILTVCVNQPRRYSKLLRLAHLNTALTSRYIKDLCARELLVATKNGYEITEKGREVLKLLRKLKTFI